MSQCCKYVESLLKKSILDFNEDEIIDFVELTKEKNLDVRFIEYMPFTGNKWEVNKLVSYRDMVKKIKSIYPDFTPLENKPNDTSKVTFYQN